MFGRVSQTLLRAFQNAFFRVFIVNLRVMTLIALMRARVKMNYDNNGNANNEQKRIVFEFYAHFVM